MITLYRQLRNNRKKSAQNLNVAPFLAGMPTLRQHICLDDGHIRSHMGYRTGYADFKNTDLNTFEMRYILHKNQSSIRRKRICPQSPASGQKASRFHKFDTFASTHYAIFALEKSISGCAAMNFFRMSCFCCSSLVGRPIAFCRWSYCTEKEAPD